MPRPKSKPAEDMTRSVDTEALQRACDARDDMAKIERAITAEQLRFSEQLGAFRGASLTRKFLDLIQIKTLAEWRESKIYKGLRVVGHEGNWITIQIFGDLCHAIGVSYETANEWISNYQALGEDFLREADAAGIGVRDLRRLRKLPDNEIEAAKELLKTDGKQAVVEFVEDLCAKHGKERQRLEKQVHDLQGDAEAHDKLLAAKDEKLNDLHKKLHQRQSTKDWHPRAYEIVEETTLLGARISESADRLELLRETILTEDFGEDREAAIEAMAVVYYDTIWQALDVINDLSHACDAVFKGYKEKARPLVNMADVFGPYPDVAGAKK